MNRETEPVPLLTLAQAWLLHPGAAVPSPCVGVCQIDAAAGDCQGCQRTLDEIAAWSGLDTPGRLAVWARIDRRREAGRS